MVSILHISDLHFTRDAAMHNMRQILLDEVREKVHDKPKGEKLLVVTGDFHNYREKDYEDAVKFLDELIAAMDIEPAEDVFIIPGNHDVADDKVLEPIIKDAIPDWKKHKTSALKMISSGDYNFLDWRMEMFIPYCMFARDVKVYPETKEPLKDTTPAQVHIRRWRDKLNILHLNTALIADGKAKDNQLVDITNATDPELWRELYREDLPALALGHNSFYDLAEEQQDALETMFAQKNISAYLCGDTHLVELDVRRQVIPIEAGAKANRKSIPNIVCAKGVGDTTDKYSVFGYYWHEWDEDTDKVVAYFHRWRSENLAETEIEGIPANYEMRRKKHNNSRDKTLTEINHESSQDRSKEDSQKTDFSRKYNDAILNLNARLKKAQNKVRVYFWDELDFNSVYIVPYLRRESEQKSHPSVILTKDQYIAQYSNAVELPINEEKDIDDYVYRNTYLHDNEFDKHLRDSLLQEFKLAIRDQWREMNSKYSPYQIQGMYGISIPVRGSTSQEEYHIPRLMPQYYNKINNYPEHVQEGDIFEDSEEKRLSIINELFYESDIIYVVGGAGYGKSLFLKKICVDPSIIRNYVESPFLILYGDIKNMVRSDGTVKPMLDYLEERLNAATFEKSTSISPHFLEDCLNAGRCLILLDALDEVGNDLRSELHELIVSFFQESYPGNKVCITSRERGFIPKKNINCYYISRIKRTDVEKYIDNFIFLNKFSSDEKQAFLEQASSLIEKGFMQGFLTLSLLLAIYKNEQRLPTNKLLLYEKCFEFIANSREQSKMLLRNSKTGERYDWNTLNIMMTDATFMELSMYCFPNNKDISEGKIKEVIFNLYGGRFGSRTLSNINSEMFLQYCTDRTEVFIPSQYSNNDYRFFHRSFFEFFYAKNIELKTTTVDETLQAIYDLDIDSEVIELLMSIYARRNPRYLRDLLQKSFENLSASIENTRTGAQYFDSLVLMMQEIDEKDFNHKFIHLLVESADSISNLNNSSSFDLILNLLNRNYLDFIEQYETKKGGLLKSAKMMVFKLYLKEEKTISDWLHCKISELPEPRSISTSIGCTPVKLLSVVPDGITIIQNWLESFSNKAYIIKNALHKTQEAARLSKLAVSIKRLPNDKKQYLIQWIIANVHGTSKNNGKSGI